MTELRRTSSGSMARRLLAFLDGQSRKASCVLSLVLIANTAALAQSSGYSFSQTDLKSIQQFHGYGSSYVVKWIASTDDQTNCVIYDGKSDRHWVVSSHFLVGRPLLCDGGERIFLGRADKSEGPVTYLLYDQEGSALCSLVTGWYTVPSASGSYFYTINHITNPSHPVVYDSGFSVIQRLDLCPGICSWDALIIGDSLYVLRHNSTIKVYSLPEMQLLRETTLALGPGKPLYFMQSGMDGSTCAISNYVSIGIVDLATGRTDIVQTNGHNTFLIDEGGRRLYTFHSVSGGEITVAEYIHEADGYAQTAERGFDLATIDPPTRYTDIDTVYLQSEQLIVDFLSIKGRGENLDKRLYSLVIETPLTAESSAKLLPSPCWPGPAGSGTLRLLDFSDPRSVKTSVMGVREED